jgi:hypothetical protein
VAVSLEATFILVDKASSKLKEIAAQAKLTDKALRDMGGGGSTGMAGYQRTFAPVTQGIGKITSATEDLNAATKDTQKTADDTSKTVRVLGMNFDRTRGLLSNLTSQFRKHRDESGRLSGIFKTLIGHVTNFGKGIDNAARNMLKNHPALVNFASSLGGVAGGVKGLVTALPLLATAAIAAAPAIVALGGAIGALAGSLSFAAGGGALLGGGLLGSFAVGLGSVVAVAKPAITQLTNYRKAVTQLQTAEQTGNVTAIKTAQTRLDAISKLNPGVQQLSQNLSGMEAAWKKATAPGRAAFFDLANTAIGTLRKNMGFFATEADKNTKAVADAFKKNLGPLVDTLKPMVTMLGSIFRTNLPGFMAGVTNIFRGLSNILKVLEPQLKTFGGGFDRMTKRFDEWTSSAKGRSSIKLMGEEFKQWGRILGGVARILGDVLGAGARASQGTIKNWADSIQKFANALGGKGGTKGVQNFFQEAMKNAGKLVKPLENIAKSLAQMYTIYKPFGNVLISVLGKFPPALITGLATVFLASKAAIGAKAGYSGVRGALSGFAGKGTPTDPMWVRIIGSGGSGLSGLTSTKEEAVAEQEAKGGFFSRMRSRVGGLFGRGTAAETAVSEAEPLLASGVAAEGGGLFSKLLGGAKGLFSGGALMRGLRGGATGLALSAGIPLVESLLPKGVKNVLNTKVGRGLTTVGTDAATGLAIGGPWGAAAGAALGGVQAMGWNPLSAKGRDKFVKDMGTMWGGIKKGAGAAWSGITSVAGTAAGFVKKHWEIAGALAGPIGLGVTEGIKHFGAIKKFASGIPSFFSHIFGGLAGIITAPFKAAFGFLSGLPSKIGGVAKNIGKAAWGGIKSGAQTVAHAASGGFHAATHAVGGAVSGGLHAISSFFGADGGRVPFSAPVLVGEAGPEVLHLPTGSRVTPLSGPHAGGSWPMFGMQTGSPVRLPQPGPTPGGGGLGGGLGGVLGVDLSPQGIGQLVRSINTLTDALTGRNSLQSALQDVGTAFDDTSQSAQNDWQAIETATKTALDNISGQLTTANDTLSKSYDTLVSNIQKAMNNGVNATEAGVNKIFEAMAKAFQTLGVSTSASKRLSKAGFGGKAKKNATGGRLPGEPQGDHLPLLGRGGTLLGIADGGELVVNRHTEKRVDSKLAAYGTTLGREVAGETRPHFAEGGRVPGYATGGVVGQVNQFFSKRGWSKAAIAGILGNAWQESTGNPNTAGGGMWQQISNFGSGTGGSLEHQMETMYPQIASLRGSMNSATPAGAATIFESQFERAGIPALSNRIRYAQEAFAGKLGAGLTGGSGSFAGSVPTIRAPKIGGLLPGEIAQLGQQGINLVAAAANSTIQAAGLRAGGGMGGAGAAPMTGPKAVQAMVREADKIASRRYNYEWGGGHGAIGVPGHGTGHGSGPGVGFDCSGTVSAVLHAAGLLNTPLTSGPLMSWGAPGPGKHVTIWASPVHTFMAMNGHYFGTSGSNQGGGAGWIGQFPESMPAVRHPPGLATGGRVSDRWAGLDPVEQMRQKRNPYAILPDKGFAGGGRIPWFASGADFIARRPQLIGVGDHPSGERVQVTPQNQNPTTGRPVSITIQSIVVNRKGDVKKIVDEEMRLLAQSLGGEA